MQRPLVDDFKESTLPSLSKKKSSMPLKVCLNEERVVIFGSERFFWSMGFESVPPCSAISLGVEEHANTFAGLLDVLKLTGELFQFSLAVHVCFLSIPVT